MICLLLVTVYIVQGQVMKYLYMTIYLVRSPVLMYLFRILTMTLGLEILYLTQGWKVDDKRCCC